MLESLEEMKEFLNSYELSKLNMEDTKQAKQTRNKNSKLTQSCSLKSPHKNISGLGISVLSHNYV